MQALCSEVIASNSGFTLHNAKLLCLYYVLHDCIIVFTIACMYIHVCHGEKIKFKHSTLNLSWYHSRYWQHRRRRHVSRRLAQGEDNSWPWNLMQSCVLIIDSRSLSHYRMRAYYQLHSLPSSTICHLVTHQYAEIPVGPIGLCTRYRCNWMYRQSTKHCIKIISTKLKVVYQEYSILMVGLATF